MRKSSDDLTSLGYALTVMAGMCCLMAAPPDEPRQRAAAIVLNIQRADYEGDRVALARLYGELGPFVEVRDLTSRVLYWRGFARWRRAFNGFNDQIDRQDIDADLTQGAADFHSAGERDPAFADARIGEASCLVSRAFIHQGTPQGTELFLESRKVFGLAQAAAPDNPRLLWVKGTNQWYAPVDRGGGQEVALATYARGLSLARAAQHTGRAADPLEPAWGEPELLMNLAFMNLQREHPDLVAAERYAREALALVPYWHYVRDILMKQIQDAKSAAR